MFSLLRFFDEFFDVINGDPFLTLYKTSAFEYDIIRILSFPYLINSRNIRINLPSSTGLSTNIDMLNALILHQGLTANEIQNKI